MRCPGVALPDVMDSMLDPSMSIAIHPQPDETGRGTTALRGMHMNIQLSLAPIIALLAGILILVRPKLLAYIVAIYLIVIGILGLVGGSTGWR